jgi:beta-lactamase superfamily II metal-dependent hydrolase
VTIIILAAGGVVLGESTPIAADEENDMSISLLISFAGFRAYFGGDTEETTEVKIAQLDLAKDVDLYKSSHHGSHSSSNQLRFLQSQVRRPFPSNVVEAASMSVCLAP